MEPRGDRDARRCEEAGKRQGPMICRESTPYHRIAGDDVHNRVGQNGGSKSDHNDPCSASAELMCDSESDAEGEGVQQDA
jgi:hypothetical protein